MSIWAFTCQIWAEHRTLAAGRAVGLMRAWAIDIQGEVHACMGEEVRAHQAPCEVLLRERRRGLQSRGEAEVEGRVAVRRAQRAGAAHLPRSAAMLSWER